MKFIKENCILKNFPNRNGSIWKNKYLSLQFKGNEKYGRSAVHFKKSVQYFQDQNAHGTLS